MTAAVGTARSNPENPAMLPPATRARITTAG